MIEIEIKMVDGSSHIISSESNSIKEFVSDVFAPYGNIMSFIELFPGVIINTSNVISLTVNSENIKSEEL